MILFRRTALFLVVLALSACAPQTACGAGAGSTACVRVLFIGNSYTYVNDLPRRFADLSAAGGHPVETGMEATGGWTLAQHAASPQTRARLTDGTWDYVVLQEQSEIPALADAREAGMYPAVRDLAGRIRAAGARPVLFLTWAHRDGMNTQGQTMDYPAMQDALTDGYRQIAGELGIPIAPVGEAWWLADFRDPGLSLWDTDGSHPSGSGTYLAACVFYATLFRQSPEGLAYTGGLPEDTARLLQTAAAEAVLQHTDEWNLP